MICDLHSDGRHDTPGGNPGIYSPYAIDVPGKIGQMSDLFFDGTYVLSCADMLRCVPEIGLPKFLWIAGDDITPRIGPTLTKTGVIVNNRPTPWQFQDGTRVVADAFDGTAYFSAVSSVIDPPVGHDLIVLACVRRTALTDSTAHGYRYIVANSDIAAGTTGWGLAINVNNSRIVFRLQGAAGSTQAVTTSSGINKGAWMLCGGVMNDDTNSVAFEGPTAGTSVATPAGEKFDGSGLFLGVDATLAVQRILIGDLRYLAIWIDPGIADYVEVDSYRPIRRMMRRLAGIQYIVPQAVMATFAFTRASHASFIDSWRRHHIMGRSIPRTGDQYGIRGESSGTNKTYLNINPADGVTWTVDDASAVTVIDDSTALATAGADDASVWGPNVFRYNNTSGAIRYARQGPTMGNTNKHSISIIGRCAAGSGLEVGWYVVATSTWTSVGTINANYVETRFQNLVPPSANAILCVKIPNGCDGRWIAHQTSEDAIICSSVVPNWATAAGAIRSMELLDYGWDLPDSHGSVSETVRSMCWSGVAPTVSRMIAITNSYIMATNASSRYQVNDGTSTYTCPNLSRTWTEFTPQVFRSSWGTPGISGWSDIGEGGGVYDGALAPGTIRTTFLNTVSQFKVSKLIVHRNYQTGMGVTT